MKNEFPQTVSYNRFVELQKKAAVPMGVFLKFKNLLASFMNRVVSSFR